MNMENWKLGVSSGAASSIDRWVFEAYRENGIELMEISLPYEKYAEINWRETAKNAKETNVGLWSFHLPFLPFETNNPAGREASVRKNTVQMQTEYIKRASDLGIKIAVIHPSGEPNDDNERAELLSFAKDTLAQLAENAEKYGVVIAVENLPRTCLGNSGAEMRELLAADSRLRVCFDTNHLLGETHSDFIKSVGDKIITLHISDYDFINERHWLPYEGKVNWNETFTMLENAGYEGPFMYELGLETPPSIKRERALTFADFRINHSECINRLRRACDE